MHVFNISFLKQKIFIVCIICQSCFLQHLNFRALLNTTIVPRIVAGTAANLGDVPHQVAFKKRTKGGWYSTFCGGSIISPRKVVTAAHCFSKRRWFDSDCNYCRSEVKVKSNAINRVYAVAGNLKNRVKKSDNEGQWLTISKGVYPKDYKFPRADIALITTSGSFTYNSYVKPIPMASRHIEYNMKCLASGYGRLSITKKKRSPILFLALMDMVPTSVCNVMHRRNMIHTVCTTSRIPDTAQGDSGGPLVCKNTGDPKDKGQGILAGVVSGHRVGVGSFFTRVSSFRRFLNKHSHGTRNINSILNVFLTIYVTFFLF